MNFFRTVLALCTGFSSYRSVSDRPVGASIGYLAKLMTLLALVMTASLIPWASDLGNESARWVDEHFPAFSIRDGSIVTTVEQPWVGGDDRFRVILDTTGKVTAPDFKAPQGVLFLADSFTVWVTATNLPSAAARTRSHSLAGFPDGEVNGDYFRKLIRSFLWVSLPVAWPILALLGILMALVQAYLFSLVASLAERGLPGQLPLARLLTIAIHAATPAAIVVTAYAAMQLKGLNLWLVYLVVYGVFLIGGTAACRADDAKNVPE